MNAELSEPEKYVVAFQAGASSRDAEVDSLQAALDGWLFANGPNGWITSLRNECDTLREQIATLRADANEVQAARHVQREHNDLLVKNHKLREQVKLLRGLLDCSENRNPDRNPEIAAALAATETREQKP